MKKNLKFLYPLLCAVLLFSATSCKEDLDFSTNPADKLSFSIDTVKFDTVFTTIGSSTRQFKIFNRSSKPLNIESINLAGASTTGFSVVVDGRRGTTFSNVEIGANDSLFVYVEVTVNPNNVNNPLLISDALVFRTNGNEQQVRFEAYGQDVIILNKLLTKKVIVHREGRSDTITVINTIFTDTTLTGERPFLVYDSLVVREGAKLTLAPGVKLFFHDKAFCRVDGTISSKGSVGNPVVFRGDRMDYLLPDLPYDRYPGQWGGVFISTGSFGNEMDHTQIRNGKYGLRLDSSNVDQQKISLKNCVFKNVTGIVLEASNCDVEAMGCEFTNGGEDVVRLVGGSYTFVHCTLMNSFPFSSKGNSSAITLSNYMPAPVAIYPYPLKKADFTNCIIYGKKSLEVNEAGKTNNLLDNPYNYLFLNCLIKANGSDDTDASKPIHFTNVLWNKDPKFIKVNNDDKFIYDMRLDSLSEAVDKGIPNVADQCPIDIYGNLRLGDGSPDLGAYERVKVNGK